MTNSNISIIIVAAGAGTRMGRTTPKQFLSLLGEPILIRTLKRFASALPSSQIIVVLPKAHILSWKRILEKNRCQIEHQIAVGGESRTQSVQNGLNLIKHGTGVVLIHDGVRPLTTQKLIEKIVDLTLKHKAVIPAVAITDSIRKIEGDRNYSVDRELYKAVQTPQGFDIELIKKAYMLAGGKQFTDDAAAIENLGAKVEITEGEKTNIKITTLEDMVIARSILKREK